MALLNIVLKNIIERAPEYNKISKHEYDIFCYVIKNLINPKFMSYVDKDGHTIFDHIKWMDVLDKIKCCDHTIYRNECYSCICSNDSHVSCSKDDLLKLFENMKLQ